MLERAFSAAFRNLSTLFLMVALFTVPLHVGYSYLFRDVIEVRKIHSSIEGFPSYRQVKNVGPDELRTARLTYLGLSVLELALLLPLLARATARVLEVDAAGGVPTIPRALRCAVPPPDARPQRPRDRGDSSCGVHLQHAGRRSSQERQEEGEFEHRET